MLYAADRIVGKETVGGMDFTVFFSPEDAARFREFWDEVVYAKMGVTLPNPNAFRFVGRLEGDNIGLGVVVP